MLRTISHGLLKDTIKKFKPVFANKVFVVFSNRKDLQEVTSKSPLIIFLGEDAMQVEKETRSALSGIVGRALGKLKRLSAKIGGTIFQAQFLLLKTLKDKARGRDMVYLGNNRALTRTVWGHKMFLDTRDVSLTPHFLLDGYWEMWITKVFMKIVREGMTMVEVGANIGYYTLLAASRVGVHGKVYAFEANPQVFEILYRNIEVNGFLDRVTLVNKAVIDRSGSLTFHCPKYHQAGGSIVPFSDEFLKEKREKSETIEVETVSLDEYFAHQHGKIDILKIDAEGAEPFIFRGMKKLLAGNSDIKIVCEFTPPRYASQGLDPSAFLNEILKQGFKVKLINLQSKLENISIERLLEIPYSEVLIER